MHSTGDYYEIARNEVQTGMMTYATMNTDEEYNKALVTLLSGVPEIAEWNDSVGGQVKEVLQMVGYLPSAGVGRYNPSRLKSITRESNGYLERIGKL